MIFWKLNHIPCEESTVHYHCHVQYVKDIDIKVAKIQDMWLQLSRTITEVADSAVKKTRSR